jgi:hypothetical protein
MNLYRIVLDYYLLFVKQRKTCLSNPANIIEYDPRNYAAIIVQVAIMLPL